MTDKLTNISDILAVLQLTGWRGTRDELEDELARWGCDVCIPGVQGEDKVMHREIRVYGTTMDPASRCRVLRPPRIRQDLVPEYMYSAEYDDTDAALPERASGGRRTMGDEFRYDPETGKYERTT